MERDGDADDGAIEVFGEHHSDNTKKAGDEVSADTSWWLRCSIEL